MGEVSRERFTWAWAWVQCFTRRSEDPAHDRTPALAPLGRHGYAMQQASDAHQIGRAGMVGGGAAQSMLGLEDRVGH